MTVTLGTSAPIVVTSDRNALTTTLPAPLDLTAPKRAWWKVFPSAELSTQRAHHKAATAALVVCKDAIEKARATKDPALHGPATAAAASARTAVVTRLSEMRSALVGAHEAGRLAAIGDEGPTGYATLLASLSALSTQLDDVASEPARIAALEKELASLTPADLHTLEKHRVAAAAQGTIIVATSKVGGSYWEDLSTNALKELVRKGSVSFVREYYGRASAYESSYTRSLSPAIEVRTIAELRTLAERLSAASYPEVELSSLVELIRRASADGLSFSSAGLTIQGGSINVVYELAFSQHIEIVVDQTTRPYQHGCSVTTLDELKAALEKMVWNKTGE